MIETALLGARNFAEPALASIPRALGLTDRDPASSTYGCLDRAYWHYRLADFPSAWFAAGSYLLAQAAMFELPGNTFFGSDRVRDWALACAAYATAQAHRDGSLAEVYPYERSYCATAFAALHVGLALETLGAPVSPGLRKIAGWLATTHPTDAANQVAAAAAALAVTGKLAGDDALSRAADSLREKLLAEQKDGFFPEYGGPDVGYQTVTLSCLAHLANHRPDASLEDAARRGGAALEPLVREDGNYEWRTTRRRTQFLYPSGLLRWAPLVAGRLRAGLEKGRVLTPTWLDDRYFMHLAVDFMNAARHDLAHEKTP